MISPLRKTRALASRMASLPGLDIFSPPDTHKPTAEERRGYLKSQRLAFDAAETVAGLLRPGWTERRAAEMLNTYLRDHGVSAFFHQGFAWFGERCRFDGIQRYRDFLPSQRILRDGECFILDVAPIVSGYIADIGYSGFQGDPNSALGQNHRLALDFLKDLREDLLDVFASAQTGREIWTEIDRRISRAGFDNIHQKYPFSVLGHRVHRVRQTPGINFGIMNFGWQSFWSITSRGVFGQLLNRDHEGSLDGLWAIEPHIGISSAEGGIGAKFEEILVVERVGNRSGGSTRARWLDKTLRAW